MSVVFDDQGFGTGLVVGAAALLAVVAVVIATGLLRPDRPRAQLRGRRRPPVAGITVVAASIVALDRAGPQTLLSGRLVAGLAILAIGPFAATWLFRQRRWWSAVAALAAVPGAAVVAWSTADYGAGWVPALVFGATVIGGALITDFDGANASAGLGPVLLAVTVAGMYSTLPDTEQVIVVMGAALPLAFLGSPMALAAFGPGAYGVVGLLGWVAAVGGRGRPGAVVGALACLGVMLVEPLVRRAARGRLRSPQSPRSGRTVLVILLQAAVVAVAARIAGLETSGTRAATIAAIALAAAAVVVVVVLAPGAREKSRSSAEPTARRGPAEVRNSPFDDPPESAGS